MTRSAAPGPVRGRAVLAAGAAAWVGLAITAGLVPPPLDPAPAPDPNPLPDPIAAPPAAAPRPAGAAVGARARALAYSRLAKAEFYDFYLSLVVVLAALPGALRTDGRSLLTLLLFGIGEVGVVAAVMAFDDVTGYLDGSDVANYADPSGLRKRHRKPLLDGVLTVREAVRFGRLALLWGAVWWALAVAAAPHRPLWAVLITAAVLVFSVQYSTGLKLSYRGGAEALIATSPLAIVVAPYGLVTGQLPAFVLVSAVLFGLWQVLVSAYSNSNDVDGDRAVGRRNAATALDRRGNTRFLTLLTLADPLLVLGAAALGWAPAWFPLVLLVPLAMRARQLRTWLRTGDPLLARRHGVLTFRAGVAALVVAHLVNLA
jgi:1,4-dihydroxy-2-naphthoate polyprenyltransferase